MAKALKTDPEDQFPWLISMPPQTSQRHSLPFPKCQAQSGEVLGPTSSPDPEIERSGTVLCELVTASDLVPFTCTMELGSLPELWLSHGRYLKNNKITLRLYFFHYYSVLFFYIIFFPLAPVPQIHNEGQKADVWAECTLTKFIY